MTDNKAIARRVFEEGFNKGDMAFADQVLSPNHTSHDPNNPPDYKAGPEGMKQIIRMYRAAFPDLHFVVDEQISEGNRVVTRWTSRGTHKGPLMELGPTGKSVTVVGMTIDRIENGKVMESWVNWDLAGLMNQLTGKAQQRLDGGRQQQQPHR